VGAVGQATTHSLSKWSPMLYRFPDLTGGEVVGAADGPAVVVVDVGVGVGVGGARVCANSPAMYCAVAKFPSSLGWKLWRNWIAGPFIHSVYPEHSEWLMPSWVYPLYSET
jgi:hypothetical protein